MRSAASTMKRWPFFMRRMATVPITRALSAIPSSARSVDGPSSCITCGSMPVYTVDTRDSGTPSLIR
ncbi:hypothetical protein D3C78_1767730 [compost metagenome]